MSVLSIFYAAERTTPLCHQTFLLVRGLDSYTVCLCFYTVINQAIQMEYFDSLMVLRQHLNWTASIWFSYLWVFLFLALWISIKESKWYLPWRFDYGGWNKHCSQTAYFIFAQPPSDNLSCVCSANFWSRIRLAVLLWFLVVICLLSQHAKSKNVNFFSEKRMLCLWGYLIILTELYLQSFEKVSLCICTD